MPVPLRIFLFTFIFSAFIGCVQKTESQQQYFSLENGEFNKINGVSFVASRDSIQQKNIQPLLNIHANYAAIMPFGFIKSVDHPQIIYDQKRQWFGETMEGVKQYKSQLRKSNIKVMLKPQIWIWHGEFTGFLQMASEEDWLQLEKSYRNFIMDFAKLAEEENIEIFCIGTELEKFIEHRPKYWRNLIAEIRKVYSGKLTYAANWDEYKRVPFWDAVDYIGVDAYFPISEDKTPTVEEIKNGWKIWKDQLQNISEREDKKIIFTEYGYRSIDFAAKEPWLSNREINATNLQAQANLLEGLYQSVWDEKWFAGGFLWKWFIVHDGVGGADDTQFTPQNKPAETVVAKYYKESKK